jgi:peptidoglycan/xylan/chitin deacetylase (PgdA/CDA1 family)
MPSFNHIVQKARAKARWKTNDLLAGAGLKKFVPPAKPVQRILVYHGIDTEGNTRINSRFLSQAAFDAQVRFFREHFHLVSLDDFYKGNVHDSRSTVAITFDDGYANNLYRALPVLEKHNAPATFFITTIRDVGYDILWPDALDLSAYTDGSPFELRGERFVKRGKKGYHSEQSGLPLKETCKNYGFDYKAELLEKLPGLASARSDRRYAGYHTLLTGEEIRLLGNSPLATIGSHGYYHNCLERIPGNDAREELVRSKNYLETLLEKEVDALAFPDGRYTPAVVELAKAAGYRKLLPTDLLFGDREDEWMRPRFVINPHISLFNQMLALVEGGYR